MMQLLGRNKEAMRNAKTNKQLAEAALKAKMRIKVGRSSRARFALTSNARTAASLGGRWALCDAW